MSIFFSSWMNQNLGVWIEKKPAQIITHCTNMKWCEAVLEMIFIALCLSIFEIWTKRKVRAILSYRNDKLLFTGQPAPTWVFCLLFSHYIFASWNMVSTCSVDHLLCYLLFVANLYTIFIEIIFEFGRTSVSNWHSRILRFSARASIENSISCLFFSTIPEITKPYYIGIRN